MPQTNLYFTLKNSPMSFQLELDTSESVVLTKLTRSGCAGSGPQVYMQITMSTAQALTWLTHFLGVSSQYGPLKVERKSLLEILDMDEDSSFWPTR